ncbi:MAG: hypothetical protein NTZ47_11985 [Bacteroidetes bacterium]|nr:hypothetical protein [Bacteroidota bacterium]
MKFLFCLFTLILVYSNAIGQSIFRSKAYGFEMQSPKNWNEATNAVLMNNLAKLYNSNENLQKILQSNKGSLLLSSFYKYDPQFHPGLIPTIKINVRQKTDVDFGKFMSNITQSAKGFFTIFKDFEYLTAPTEIEISGIKSVYFIGKFTLRTQDGQEMKVRSRTYAIPRKNYFFQVNFMDGQTEEDCKDLFDSLIKTIKINSIN